MIVRVVPSYKGKMFYTVELKQGCQYFRLDYHATKKLCQWYAKMFRLALRKRK